MIACADNSKGLSESTRAGSLHIVYIAIPGRAAEWTRLITNAFADGADAILAVAEGIQVAEGTIDVMADALARHPEALLGGRVFGATRSYHVYLDGYWWSDSELKWCRESYMEPIRDLTAPLFRPANWLSAAALAIPRRVWEATGGFDERFGSFLSDVDFCVRARRQGFKCLLVRNGRFATTRADNSFDPMSESERLQSTLLLARRHRLPRGMVAMAWRHTTARLTEEFSRVDYWTDYGVEIGWPRRTLWYVGNCLEALRRERLRGALRQILLSTRMAAAHWGRRSAG